MFLLEYTPFIWPFIVSLAITAGLGHYAFRRRHVPAASIFGMLMYALTAWTACYVLELMSTTLAAKTFWASAKYFGSAPGPVLWFVLALHLTKKDRWLTPPVIMVLSSYVITTCLVVFTNDVHHWFWTDIYLLAGFPETQADHGFYFWVYAATIYSLVLMSVVLYFQYYRTTPALYRRQAALMALGGFVPLGGRLVEDFLKIDVFPKVDNIILLFLFSGIVFAVAIFRYGAFDIVHVAHNLVIQNIPAGIIVLDMQERVLELNPYAKGLVGVRHGSAIGKALPDVLEGWPTLEIAREAEQEIMVLSAGARRWFHLQSSQMLSENGMLAGYTIILLDITARKQAEQQLAALARTDALTGITNRRHFLELAEGALERARRHRRPVAILLFDIDHFKQVNDTYGHHVGDEVIRSVARTCKEYLRTTDIIARYGGEEFVCLVDEADHEGARQTAERLRQVVEDAHVEVDGHTLRKTISIGVGITCDGALSVDELINRADEALYTSKSSGRNCVTVWSQQAVLAMPVNSIAPS